LLQIAPLEYIPNYLNTTDKPKVVGLLAEVRSQTTGDYTISKDEY